MPELIRCHIKNSLTGYALAVGVITGPMWFNVANLWHLVSRSDTATMLTGESGNENHRLRVPPKAYVPPASQAFFKPRSGLSIVRRHEEFVQPAN